MEKKEGCVMGILRLLVVTPIIFMYLLKAAVDYIKNLLENSYPFLAIVASGMLPILLVLAALSIK
jgi:hypothetical protein